MKIRFQVHALNEALNVANIVPPRPVTADGVAGFLFTASETECCIYARDETHQTRVKVPFESVDGEGSFIFPADKVPAIRYLDGWIEFESGVTDDRFWVRYESESGAKQDDVSTVDPRIMESLDSALNAAAEGTAFPAALLREAINTTKPYLSKPGDEKVGPQFKTLQLFDGSKDANKKGDGFLYAADGVRNCSFYCDQFEGKALSIHVTHLSYVLSFLGKCQGAVQIRHGKGVTYLVNSLGQVLGWANNVVEHSKFTYYGLKNEAFVLRTDKEPFVRALRHIRAALDAKRDKIRIQYDHEKHTLLILASEGTAKVVSRPIVVEPIQEEGEGGEKSATEGFATNLNLNHLLELIEPIRGNRFDLRIACVPPDPGSAGSAAKDRYLLRTIDAFVLDEGGKPIISKKDTDPGKAVECRVTRFIPSRD